MKHIIIFGSLFYIFQAYACKSCPPGSKEDYSRLHAQLIIKGKAKRHYFSNLLRKSSHHRSFDIEVLSIVKGSLTRNTKIIEVHSYGGNLCVAKAYAPPYGELREFFLEKKKGKWVVIDYCGASSIPTSPVKKDY